MDQPFHSGLQFHECSVVGQANNFALNAHILGIAHIGVQPGILGHLFVAQRNSSVFLGEFDDFDREFVADGEELGRMIDSSPRHIRDVQQTVDTAKVNEGSVIGNVFDDTFHYFAAFQDFHGFCFFFLHGFFEDGFAGEHDIAALLVHLDDAHFKLFAAQAIEVAHGTNIDLRSGQECTDADVDGQAAFDALNDASLDDGPFPVGTLDLIPDLHPFGFFPGQDDIAVGILGLFQKYIDGISCFDGDLAAIVRELLDGNNPFGFESDIDNDSAARDGDDSCP